MIEYRANALLAALVGLIVPFLLDDGLAEVQLTLRAVASIGAAIELAIVAVGVDDESGRHDQSGEISLLRAFRASVKMTMDDFN